MNLLKERLDVLLVQQGFFQSREKAKAAIMAGIVFAGGQRIDKAGTQMPADVEIFVKENRCPYVSRGGLKLEKALNEFHISLSQVVAMDIGASTGGFTDCMLQNGAEKVYAVDVGYGQLDWKLRSHERVVVMEKTNIRHLELSLISDPLDFISMDVSFISLKLVFPVAVQLLGAHGQVVCLVKPQFEAGREQVGKNGIVREPHVQEEVIRRVIGYGLDNGLYAQGLTYSPVTGAKGNIEYLLHMSKDNGDIKLDDTIIHMTVQNAHDAL